jgi:uncharacterized protein (DUF924 family)
MVVVRRAQRFMTDAAPVPAIARDILDFWFLPAGHIQHNRYRHEWFSKDEAFDAEIRARFGLLIEAALAGELAEWDATAGGALAHIVLLDQFPRNIFRNTTRAFAGDAQALALATQQVAAGRDKNLPPIRRWFSFMPFMHSEAFIDQERSVALFAGLRREAQHEVFDAAYDFAVRHHAIIERFGRFPHRNALLGRRSTDEEIQALELPGFHF